MMGATSRAGTAYS